MAMPTRGGGIHFAADPEFRAVLERGVRLTGKPKSALLREALVAHVARLEAEALARELERAYEGLNEVNRDLDREMHVADAPWPTARGAR
ncbi:MAG: hypothetical protein FJ087_04635 [Deltaproteobacteria bacterium]|nr:hypothetical protein [Deltaproteobacteria bacterium]